MKKSFTKNPKYFAFIKPLYLLTNFLAISPPYKGEHATKKEDVILLRAFKIWSSVIGTIMLSTYAYCMIGASREIFNQVQMTTTVIEIILFSSVTMSNVISVFGAGFINANAWKSMLNTLVEISDKLNVSLINKRRLRLHYGLIVVGHVFFVGILSFDFYVGEKIHGIGIYQYHFILRVQYYFVFVTVVLICLFARSIRNR